MTKSSDTLCSIVMSGARGPMELHGRLLTPGYSFVFGVVVVAVLEEEVVRLVRVVLVRILVVVAVVVVVVVW